MNAGLWEKKRGSKVAHQAKALATKFDKLSLIPGPHIGKERTKSYMSSYDHICLAHALHMHTPIRTPHTYTHNKEMHAKKK